jgi:hypothetical protein
MMIGLWHHHRRMFCHQRAERLTVGRGLSVPVATGVGRVWSRPVADELIRLAIAAGIRLASLVAVRRCTGSCCASGAGRIRPESWLTAAHRAFRLLVAVYALDVGLRVRSDRRLRAPVVHLLDIVASGAVAWLFTGLLFSRTSTRPARSTRRSR